jgi:hypothetical protein
MTTLDDPPVALPQLDGAPGVGTPIDGVGDRIDRSAPYGVQLRQIRTAAADFRTAFAATGTPDVVSTHDLVSLPYPTGFGLFRSALTPAPYLCITNRMLVVRWPDGDRLRTLLFEPSDYELGEGTHYFARLHEETPAFVEDRVVTRHGTVVSHLAALGIAPEEVDYLAFDHLHTQDVRRWIGTTTPQADLSPDAPVAAAIPERAPGGAAVGAGGHARPAPAAAAVVPACDVHRPAPGGPGRVDGDVLLGPGRRPAGHPGHAVGNQSLVLNTSTGIWASARTRWRRVPGARALAHPRRPPLAQRWGREVVLNSNTPEALADQYGSIVLEKTLVDAPRPTRASRSSSPPAR